MTTELQNRIDAFDQFVAFVGDWGVEKLADTDDARYPLYAALAVALVIDAENVPVSKEAWDDSQFMLQAYSHILPDVINTMSDIGFLTTVETGEGLRVEHSLPGVDSASST